MILYRVALIETKRFCKQLNIGLNLSIGTISLKLTDMNTVLEHLGITNVYFHKFLEEHHH